MTAAATLLSRLADLGVTARADGGVLRLRPASIVPADLLADLRDHKPERLALLTANDAAPPPPLPPPSKPPPKPPTGPPARPIRQPSGPPSNSWWAPRWPVGMLSRGTPWSGCGGTRVAGDARRASDAATGRDPQ